MDIVMIKTMVDNHFKCVCISLNIWINSVKYYVILRKKYILFDEDELYDIRLYNLHQSTVAQ